MSDKEKLIQRILNADDPKRLINTLNEAIEMMHQGKSDDEIKAHFGIA